MVARRFCSPYYIIRCERVGAHVKKKFQNGMIWAFLKTGPVRCLGKSLSFISDGGHVAPQSLSQRKRSVAHGYLVTEVIEQAIQVRRHIATRHFSAKHEAVCLLLLRLAQFAVVLLIRPVILENLVRIVGNEYLVVL